MKIRTIASAVAVLVAAPLVAQPALPLPDASPKASVAQTIGVTNIEIDYHRPAVNKRKIFGGLVSYGAVWRAGANENTTISFSTPVTIEGQALAAGTYGLFMIPTATTWTVVFSKATASWGAYAYDASEDAARVTVTPQAMAEAQERMIYTFDDFANNSVVASLRWDKTRVPFKIGVDLPATVRASIRDALRGGKHWDPNAWAAAARWELRNGDADTALKYADKAMEYGNNVTTLRTKAAVLDKKGDKAGAKALRDRAMTMANETETLSITVGGMMGDKKYDDALKYLNDYLAAHSNSENRWRILVMIGDAQLAKGDAAKATASYASAMAAARDAAEREEVQDSINAMGATPAP
jgi:predicted negative regulator of RcsB-dependent stress response